MLDEPFSGVDPIAVYDVQQIIVNLRATGLGILITDTMCARPSPSWTAPISSTRASC